MLTCMASAATWRKRVDEWQAIGLKAKEFAEAHGLSVHQLWNWAAIFRKEERAESVEAKPMVVPAPPPTVEASKNDSIRLARVVRVPVQNPVVPSTPLSIEFSEVRIVVPDGFDPSTFALVLDAIERRKARPVER